MTKNDQKKVVIVRGINSNVIEEAILILRNENYLTVKSEKIKEKRNITLINEVNSIINSYEENLKKSEKTNKTKKLNKFQKIIIGLYTIAIITATYLIYIK